METRLAWEAMVRQALMQAFPNHSESHMTRFHPLVEVVV
jgi:hypothetical protein